MDPEFLRMHLAKPVHEGGHSATFNWSISTGELSDLHDNDHAVHQDQLKHTSEEGP